MNPFADLMRELKERPGDPLPDPKRSEWWRQGGLTTKKKRLAKKEAPRERR